MGEGRKRLSLGEQRDGAAIGGNGVFGLRLPRLQQREATPRIADGAGDVERIARARAAAGGGTGYGRAAQRGEPEGARALCGQADGVSAQQWHLEFGKHRLQPVEERSIPAFIAGQAIAHQHAHRCGTLGGKVGQIDRNQLPRDIVGRITGQEMDMLDDHVVRQHKPGAADIQHGGIVHQPARGVMGGDRAQRFDEAGFGHRREA